MKSPIHALIVDDSPRSRAGLRALLTTSPDLVIVAEASNGTEAVQQAELHGPDVILMDARMPGMDGLAATRTIKRQWPDVRVVILTMYDRYREDALAAGAEAFLVKGCSLEELLAALLQDDHYPGMGAAA